MLFYVDVTSIITHRKKVFFQALSGCVCVWGGFSGSVQCTILFSASLLVESPPPRSVMVPVPGTSHNEAANMGFILVQEEASDPPPGAFLGASTGTARSK